MEKIKKIAKYVVNTLNLVSGLLIGLNAIEGITIPNCQTIVEVMALFSSTISAYLLTQKAMNKE